MPMSKNKKEFDNRARGGSTRWTGKGPQPARHIPWPEIFKHHLSVVEGHHRMIDMIRKHTIEGTGNHNAIMACLNRAESMLKDTKDASRNFVPPANHRDTVPLGSASDSMYVGYSPADHEYGEAAEEFGKAMKENGIADIKDPHGPEYKIGQSAGIGKKSLKEIKAMNAAKEPEISYSPRFTSGGNSVPIATRATKQAPQVDANPYFVVDSAPTPVAANPLKPEKRAVYDRDARPAKKSKLSQETVLPVAEGDAVECEDISAEVDARMAEKEKKRKEKKDKKEGRGSKRKRESDASTPAEAATETNGDEMDVDEHEEKAEKPKKKKSKKAKDDGEDETKEKSKKSKKSKEESSNDKKREAAADSDGEAKPKKKKSKDKDKA